MAIDGVHSRLSIRSEEAIHGLMVKGYVLPTLTFIWRLDVENLKTRKVTLSGSSIRVSWIQAGCLRRIIATSHNTEMLLMTASDILA